jgi:cysteine synthase A
MDNNIDIFVTAVGTGGTLSGVGKILKQKIPNIKIIAIEPSNSAVLSGEKANFHKIQGIGAGFIPKILDTNIYDDIIKVNDKDAINRAKQLALEEGLLVGISSGANLKVAIQLASLEENRDKNIVMILCDTGERYLSTELFDDLLVK